MNSKSGQHDREHLDLVFEYALQALPSSEIPVVEAHLSSCADCRQEVETLRSSDHRLLCLLANRCAAAIRIVVGTPCAADRRGDGQGADLTTVTITG